MQARLIIASAKSQLHAPEPWPMEIDKQEKRAMKEAFDIPTDALPDIYCARFSVVDEKRRRLGPTRLLQGGRTGGIPEETPHAEEDEAPGQRGHSPQGRFGRGVPKGGRRTGSGKATSTLTLPTVQWSL